MKGMAFRFIMASLLLALMAIVVQFAVADDESENVKIQVKAPLDAFDCAGTPPTVTVIGLTIDISQAAIKGDEGLVLGCADLRIGEVVKVTLASDIPNQTIGLLSAIEVEAEGEGCEEEECAEVEAPIQAINSIAQTITVLGLVVDISQAEIDGDDDSEGSAPPVDASQLIIGQFVEMKLASNQPPLAATEIEIKNFANGIEVEVVDANGNHIEDANDDIVIDVTVTATVGASILSTGGKTPPKGGKKVLKFRARSNGGRILNGLPTGSAKVVLTRVRNNRKTTVKSSANVASKTTSPLIVRLKSAH